MSSGGNKTTTETKIPEWMNKGGEQNFKDAQAWMKANPTTPYTGQLNAPVDANVTGASNAAAGSVGTGQSQVQAGTAAATAAGGATTPQANAGKDWTAAGVASSYMNPYVQQVQQATLREMGNQSKINQNAVSDAAGSAKAFGGDRHGIMAAEQAKNDSNAMSDYLARSNEAAYTSGMSQFNTDRGFNTDVSKFNSGLAAGDLDRQLGSAGVLGQLGNTAAGIASSDVQRLLSTGMASQGIAQDAAGRNYDEWLRQQSEPLNRYGQLAGIMSGTPTSQSTTSGQKGSVMNTVLGGAQIAASILPMLSDARAKENVVATGDRWHGLPVFEFDYRKDLGFDVPEGRFRGVMSQDAILEYPEAVAADSNGYLAIDYERIARSNIQ
jgi:hypothetical protein